MVTLKKGDPAPYFSGINQDGKTISLADFAGKKLILFFYPKDNTPGCTAEACNLNENYSFWIENGYEVIGVSPDNQASHRKFAEKFGLKFNLIADTDLKILNDYGVWGEKSMYGKPYMGVLRTTFLIDGEGRITDLFTKVETKEHTLQIRTTIHI